VVPDIPQIDFYKPARGRVRVQRPVKLVKKVNKKVNKKNKIGDKKVDKRALKILEAAERKGRVKSRTRCNLV